MSLQKWISACITLLFGLVVLGQLERVELSLGRAFYLHEVVMTILVIISGLLLFTARKSIPFSREFRGVVWILGCINLWILISIFMGAFLQHAFTLTPLLYLARFDMYLLFGASLLFLIQRKLVLVHDLRLFMYMSITLIALLGWMQYLFIPDTRGLIFLGWDEHYLRLIGTLFDPGFTGAILMLGSLHMQQSLFSIAAPKGLRYAVFQWAWLLCVSALAFTYSRASFVAYLLGTAFLFARERKRAYLAIMAFFVLAIVCLPRPRSEGARLERTASIVSRVDTVTSGIGGLSPLQYLIGKGWYADKEEALRLYEGTYISTHNSAPENSFVFIFVSLGAIGSILFAVLGWKLIRLSAHDSASLSVFVALGVHALFSNTLFYPLVLFYGIVIIVVTRFIRNN